MLSTSQIRIRDPFVLPIAEESAYYLYGTTDITCWGGAPIGFETYVSKDLVNWDGPYPVFRPDADFWGKECFWAPEVHCYRGRYFMFATFSADNTARATQILVADSPRGPFLPYTHGPITPDGWMCLDGTLFVDPDGVPWVVFCHEWVQVGDGEILAMPLKADLSAAAGDPILLFSASQAEWARPVDDKGSYVTDGPFLYRASNGDLLMLWSSLGMGYVQGVAKSLSGNIAGPWVIEPEVLYANDGGHGMLFQTFDGKLMLSLHSPNKSPDERPMFIPVRESDGTLVVEA